jgi:hypothetical protein
MDDAGGSSLLALLSLSPAFAVLQEREKLFWEVVLELQQKKKAERKALEDRLGDSKRTRTK